MSKETRGKETWEANTGIMVRVRDGQSNSGGGDVVVRRRLKWQHEQCLTTWL